jgi:hypothetical protein
MSDHSRISLKLMMTIKKTIEVFLNLENSQFLQNQYMK